MNPHSIQTTIAPEVITDGLPSALIASSHGCLRTTALRIVSEMFTRMPATIPPAIRRPVLIRPMLPSFLGELLDGVYGRASWGAFDRRACSSTTTSTEI